MRTDSVWRAEAPAETGGTKKPVWFEDERAPEDERRALEATATISEGATLLAVVADERRAISERRWGWSSWRGKETWA